MTVPKRSGYDLGVGFFKNLLEPAPVPSSYEFSLADILISEALNDGSYGTKKKLAIASVYRARMLNADVPASLPVYAGDVLLEDTADLVSEIILSLQDHGDAYLIPDGSGSFSVVRYQDVSVTWDEGFTRRVYRHATRGVMRTEGLSPSLFVLSVNRGAEDLTGFGWMESERLEGVLNEQNYASEYWANSGQPTGTVNVPGKLTKEQAELLRAQWVEARTTRSPAVLSANMTWTGSSFNMADSQWTEGHLVNIGDIASLSGCPAYFLSYSPAGSSLVYNSGSDVWRMYYSATLQPTFISRIERVWSKIAGVSVRFDPEQLLIASLQERSQAASVLAGAGYDLADVADVCGLPPMGEQTVPEDEGGGQDVA